VAKEVSRVEHPRCFHVRQDGDRRGSSRGGPVKVRVTGYPQHRRIEFSGYSAKNSVETDSGTPESSDKGAIGPAEHASGGSKPPAQSHDTLHGGEQVV